MIIRIILLYIILIISKQACAQETITSGASAYLSLDTWKVKERYSASHALMVPLHYAYKYDDKKLKKDFDSNIERFQKTGNKEINLKKDSERLSSIQYLYLLSEYAVLSKNKELANYVLKQINIFWYDIPAWQWDRKPFKNLKERVEWKLTAGTEVGYRRVIIDEEFFSFGIAANLTKIYPKELVLKEINHYALKVFKQRSSFDEEGRWLFDKGNYDDYKDHAYAGYENKIIKEKRPLKDMVSDSSHFFRIPKILLSLQNSYPMDSNEFNLYKKFRKVLAKHFLERVIKIRNNKIYLTNYMDGRNGVFRWGYPSLGENNGYGPYGLTGSFGIGWWSFLHDNEIDALYNKYYQEFNSTGEDELCKSIIENTKQKKYISNFIKFNRCMRIYNSYMASKL
ncbi:hypothetical protein [Acinetobacter sp. YK3]|uniref:hypothetical protein n=1 Tax=Acinetobacter sp. YK3 TaxID=1860097 RepID=UPI001112EDC1|nr:hypothetical protein [Acinetobacter sp. YK3]